MNSGIIEKFLGGLLLFMLTGITIMGFNEEEKEYIYKCTDYAGNTIYCTHAYTSRGGLFGYMEDGTRITITSYKEVLKSEGEEDE